MTTLISGGGTSRPVALVTGASAGIGTAFAHVLAQREYDLVLVARRRDRLDALEKELAASGSRVLVIARDLVGPGAVASIVSEIAGAGLTIDLLVNNAGFGYHGAFASSDPEGAERMVALNVGVLVELSRAFVGGMVERGRGGIINVASTAAFQPVPAMAVYGATKAFVLSFSEALHEEVRRSGVRVVALCPGATDTEFVRTGMRAHDRIRAVAIDGFANAALAAGVRFMPRAVVARLSARLMGAK
jgi:short-subunit dehydrogenase